MSKADEIRAQADAETETLARELLDVCHLQSAPIVIAALSAALDHICHSAQDGPALAPGYSNERTIDACVSQGRRIAHDVLADTRATQVVDWQRTPKA